MSGKSDSESAFTKPVRRFLRHRASHTYFKDGGWTADPAEANTYSDVLEVAEACARYRLSDVEVALRYERSSCDLFCTPLR
jgi:hypothetical protein